MECLYPALDFAKRIGMAPYQTITGFHAQVLLGEWIFAEAAFHQSPRDEEYLDHFFPGRDHAGFYRLRKKAGEFVNQFMAGWGNIVHFNDIRRRNRRHFINVRGCFWG